jgi:sigma-B regulation protein RsbU (phosphoserine phosphatase)
MSIFDLLHPEDRERTRGGFEHLKRGNPILRFENRYRRKDGSYNWFA